MTTERWICLAVALAGAAAVWWNFRAAADPGGGAVRRVFIRSGVLRTRWTHEEPGSARVLEYDIPTEGFPGRIRRTLRMQPLKIIMVCVHASGAITGHSVLDIN